jgi:hypothetical protein
MLRSDQAEQPGSSTCWKRGRRYVWHAVEVDLAHVLDSCCALLVVRVSASAFSLPESRHQAPASEQHNTTHTHTHK